MITGKATILYDSDGNEKGTSETPLEVGNAQQRRLQEEQQLVAQDQLALSLRTRGRERFTNTSGRGMR